MCKMQTPSKGISTDGGHRLLQSNLRQSFAEREPNSWRKNGIIASQAKTIVIDLENCFRQPNQFHPKSMDAVFVGTVGVRANAQCCWVRCVHAAHQAHCDTLLSPAPTQLKNSGQNRSFSFLEKDVCQEVGLLAKNAELVFSLPRSNHTHSHPDPSLF